MSQPQQTQRLRLIKSRKKRRQKFRRLLVMTTIAICFVYATYSIYASHRAELNEVQADLRDYQRELDEIMLRQGFYENQVIRLEDEDYVAMLARERLFRSMPNEIIFRLIDLPATEIDYENEN